MIKSGAEKIYPSEVEDVLLQNPKIAEVAVLGVPDAMWGQTPKALLVSKLGQKVTKEEIIEFCKSRLPGFKRPRIIQFVAELPHTGSGEARSRGN